MVPKNQGIRDRRLDPYPLSLIIFLLESIMAEISQTVKAEEVIVLRPSRGWSALNLRDLWLYR